MLLAGRRTAPELRKAGCAPLFADVGREAEDKAVAVVLAISSVAVARRPASAAASGVREQGAVVGGLEGGELALGDGDGGVGGHSPRKIHRPSSEAAPPIRLLSGAPGYVKGVNWA